MIGAMFSPCEFRISIAGMDNNNGILTNVKREYILKVHVFKILKGEG